MVGQGEGDICGEGDGMAEAVAVGVWLVSTGGGVAVAVIVLVGLADGVVAGTQAASNRDKRTKIKKCFTVLLLEDKVVWGCHERPWMMKECANEFSWRWESRLGMACGELL